MLYNEHLNGKSFMKNNRSTTGHRVLWIAILLFGHLLFSANVNASPFDKGEQHFNMSVGSGSLLGDDYIILGIGYGYYFQKGLELGINFDLWLDGDPTIYQVTPEAKYVFQMFSTIKPYVGTFYRRNYIEGFDDRDAYGYRAGIYWLTGGRGYFGYGITHSRLQDCEESIYNDCESTYSEFSFTISIR
jgi:hypothetical protein